jgi:hypothetical protein
MVSTMFFKLINRWFKQMPAKQRTGSCRRPAIRAILKLEELETRVVPVIGGGINAVTGAGILAAVVAPGTNLEGPGTF